MNKTVKKLSNGDFEVQVKKDSESTETGSGRRVPSKYVSSGRSAMPIWEQK